MQYRTVLSWLDIARHIARDRVPMNPAMLATVYARMRHVPRSAHELRALVDEVVDADWRHPTWWTMCAAFALLQAFGREQSTADDFSAVAQGYANSDGGPRGDTFIGRARPRATGHSHVVADAVIAARAALDVLDAFDGQLPGQPVQCHLTRVEGAIQPAPLPARDRCAFITAAGVFVAQVPRHIDDCGPLACALSAVLRGLEAPRLLERIATNGAASATASPAANPTANPTATPAAVAVAMSEQPKATVRHVHRDAWTSGGGPWFGVASTREWQVTTTSHLIVDGFGHTRITCELFRIHDRYQERAGSSLREHVARNAPPGLVTGLVTGLVMGARDSIPGTRPETWPETWPETPDAWPMGIAWRSIERDAPSFATFAYALGLSLEPHIRHALTPAQRRAYRFSPSFQVPVAPGHRDDPAHWRHRVIHALMSVPMRGGRFEPFERFQASMPGRLARERAGRGLLERMRRSILELPIAIDDKRRILGSSKVPRPLVPPVAALAGRCSLSHMRFPAHEQPSEPLIAVSTPSLEPTRADPHGGSVLTVLRHQGGFALTLCGNGTTATHAQAEAFLERYLENLDALRTRDT